MMADAAGQLAPLRCQHNDKAAPILLAYTAGNQPARGQAIENTGQGGPFMRQTTVQLADMCGRRFREQGKNMRFPLGQVALSKLIEIERNSVRRPVNGMNQAQWHRQAAVFGRDRSTTFEPHY